MPEPKSIIVAGAGIIGVCCARYLQRDGHKVILIDKLPPGEACSAGNAGVIANDSIIPLATPSIFKKLPGMMLDPLGPVHIRLPYLPRLLPWFVRFLLSASSGSLQQGAQAIAPLLSKSLEAHLDLLNQGSHQDLIRKEGWLAAYSSEKAFRADQMDRNLQQQFRIGFEEWDTVTIRDRIPQLSAAIVRGTYFPGVANTVNPQRLAKTLAEDFVKDGGEIFTADIKQVSVADRITLHGDTHEHQADKLVVAMGAWSNELAKQLGDAVPLEAERGYHMMLKNPGVQLPMPVMLAERKVVITPMEHGLRFAGTAEFASIDAKPNYARAEVFKRHAQRYLNNVQTDQADYWMGCRPTLPDSLPVIGASPVHKKVYYAFGHQHLGLTMAGITGKLIADMITGRNTGIDMQPYRVNRF